MQKKALIVTHFKLAKISYLFSLNYLTVFKGVCHEIFDLLFSMIQTHLGMHTAELDSAV